MTSSMTSPSIQQLLRNRHAWLKGTRGDEFIAQKRARLTKLISEDYVKFEALRDEIFVLIDAKTAEEQQKIYDHPEMALLLRQMEGYDLITEAKWGGVAISSEARKYLSGGWLEELAWLASIEAGADEATFGQVVGWEVKTYHGENEIDLIIRKGERLAFMSCKALRSELNINDRKQRNRLMDAVHEADNLADHFGREGEKVAVLVTTDLFDELKNVPRYQTLMGKAAILDVRVIALEELGWDRLVAAVKELLI